MRWSSRQTAVTLVGGAVLLGIELLLVQRFGDDDLLALDVFLVLFVPVVVLVLVRVRPVLHWLLFAVIVAATGIVVVTIERNESSTAGFGLVVVPFLLSVAVLFAAAFDRLLAAPSTTS